jgi:hypothetical protein
MTPSVTDSPIWSFASHKYREDEKSGDHKSVGMHGTLNILVFSTGELLSVFREKRLSSIGKRHRWFRTAKIATPGEQRKNPG